jgi:hypothetical protein
VDNQRVALIIKNMELLLTQLKVELMDSSNNFSTIDTNLDNYDEVFEDYTEQ